VTAVRRASNRLPDGELESAAEMSRALRAGEASSAELIERALHRAEAWQPRINAFSQIWPDEALDAARSIDSADRRAFAGVPIAVKDLFDVAGHETSGCSRAYRGNVAPSDASAIRAVREAGLVIIGKTNQHELAAGGTNLISASGATRNPWDVRRMTGGSSGGSAAAVAAGIVPWALGSDTGGSIRIPSSMCGTFGLKPTTGRLPCDGMLPLAPSMDCPGPIAATTRDLLELYRLLRDAGLEPADRQPEEDQTGSPAIGIPRDLYGDLVTDEVGLVVDEVAATLEGAGLSVTRVDGRGIEDAREVWGRICFSEFAEAHRLLGGRRKLVDPTVADWLERGERYSPRQIADAGRRRDEIRRWFAERLRGLDALLVPTTPYPAPFQGQLEVVLGRAGTVSLEQVGPGRLTSPVNLAGLPAVTIPAGRSSEGLPIGASLVARADEERTLLHIAARWESTSGHRVRYPSS
jgi:aspartyl-tRNA(Asn)/glutamyl-tRNA(Gln) amidotransferase subunit A